MNAAREVDDCVRAGTHHDVAEHDVRPGRVAHERAPVDGLEAAHRREHDDELAVGGGSWRPRIESIPHIPPSIDSCIEGEWSW